MRRVLLVVLFLGLFVTAAVPAGAGNGADVDRASDCIFPGVPPTGSGLWAAHDLRVQKVKTPADNGQFHCHGMIDDLAEAPSQAAVLEGLCLLPIWFGDEFGHGRAVVTPNGRINVTCHFSR